MKDMMIYIQLPLKPSPACGWPWIRRYDGSRASIPPHHLRDAACVVAVRLVDLHLQHRMSLLGVRRDKAALSSGCKPHPATAPAGSNRSSHGAVSYTHLRAHETRHDLVCRL